MMLAQQHELSAAGLGVRGLFEDIALSVRTGEVVFVTGSSGSGKSTLLKVLARLVMPDAASQLLLDGQTPEQLKLPTWRTRVLYVPPTLPDFGDQEGTAEQLCISFRSYVAQRERLAAAAAAGEDFGDLEGTAQIATRFGLTKQQWEDRKMSTLSSGERHRAFLAIMVGMRPDVLLLDEPTASLDERTAMIVEAEVRRQGLATVWVSHDPGQLKRVPHFQHIVLGESGGA